MLVRKFVCMLWWGAGSFAGGRPPLAYIFEDILLTKMNKQLNTSLRVVLANLNA